MQERRTSVRIPYQCTAQGCSSEDFLPRDGQITSLSEHGASLRTRYPLKRDTRITLNFALPADPDPVIATGVIRWLNASAGGTSSRWYASGVEWLSLEEAMRYRLRQFLYNSARRGSARGHPAGTPQTTARWIQRAAVVCAILAAGLVLSALSTLRHENRLLANAVQERETMIAQATAREARLGRDLGMARAQLTVTANEVTRLDDRARQFGEEVARLSHDVQYFEQSYHSLRAERERLIQCVLDLEQARSAQYREEALQRVIRDAIEVRRRGKSGSLLTLAPPSDWNQGYLIRDGRSTSLGPPVEIRVHEPQPAP